MVSVPGLLLILSSLCCGFWASFIFQYSRRPFTLTPGLKKVDIVITILFVATFFTIAGLAGSQQLQVSLPFFIGWCVEVLSKWKRDQTKGIINGAAIDMAIALIAFISVIFVCLSEGIMLLGYMPSYVMPHLVLAPLSLFVITLIAIRWRYQKMD